jgi:hypothetical protein
MTADYEAGAELGEDEAPIWSKLAITTFVLSLFSPLAVAVEFLFWPTTGLTALFAAAALVIVVRGGKGVRGGGLALAAIFISLFFLSLGITRFAVKRQYMEREARAVAERWFAMIQEGKLNEAHQMSMGSEYREPPEIPLEDAYRLNPRAAESRDNFFLHHPLKYLANDPKNTTVRFLNSVSRSVDEKASIVNLRFSIRYVDQDIPHETNFTIAVARYFKPKFEDHRWVMNGITKIETK